VVSHSFLLSSFFSNALPCLLALLVNPKKSIRKEACWTISNITAGNPDQIELVINANIIPPLISILKNEEFDIQKEAAWAISNATSGGTEAQIRYLANQGAIQPLCELLTCPDAKIIMVAMEGLENILRVGKNDAQADPNNVNPYADIVDRCKGLEYLEQLQNHENEDIYKKAVHILQNYFVIEGEEEEPQPAAGEQYGFNAEQGAGGAPKAGFSFGN
jgi:importin subunit alpha-1